MTESSVLKWAKFYIKTMGFSIIPIRKDKRPYIKWESYQKEKADEAQIETWWQKWPDANIGIVTGSISNLTVIDVDSDAGNDAIEEHLPDSLITPIAKSPKGKHIYFQYKEGITNATRFLTDCDIRSEGGYIIAPPSCNGSGAAYGWQLKPKDNPLAFLPDSLTNIITNAYIKGGYGGENGVQRPHVTTKTTRDHTLFMAGNRDNDLFHAANCLVKGGMKKENIEQILSLIASNGCVPPFPENEAKTKIESALKRADKREIAISQDIREWVMTTDGHFLTTESHKDLDLTTRDHKKAATMAFLRLVEEGIIEKYGNKRGAYRRIEKDEKPIEWWKDEEDSINIEWVFGLNKYIHTMPKSIYVIAGDQDAGKSAICLNMAILNCGKFPIYYFSSEMAGQELGSRLKLSESYDIHKFKETIRFIDRSRDFADVIKADAFNIIDYFEITENFYLIAKEMTRIRDKLNKGICLIALQKKKGQELGRGAEFSLEKPRLYLTIEHNYPEGNILKIIKAKNWRNPDVNPNNKYCKFKLFRGINLGPGAWEEDYE